MKKPNILFILVDTLRATNLGCYGYNKKTSPVIDSIASKGILFNNAFVSINASDPALTSIFTGLYPRTHGIIHHGLRIPQEEIQCFEEQNIKQLPNVLREQGYKTVGLDWLGRWHENGFDYYEGAGSDPIKRKNRMEKFRKIMRKAKLLDFARKIYFSLIMKYSSGKDFQSTKKAIEIIKKTNDPFFLFIHYWGIHIPYICPKKYANKFYEKKNQKEKSFADIKNIETRKFYEERTKNEKSFEQIKARYDGSIKYIDEQIRMILEALKQSKKEDNTIIVVVSDHGESLTEHNILFDHHGLYDATIKIPLIIKYPNQIQPKKINALVQQVDIMPTLLSMLNINTNINFDGINLIPLINGEVNKIRNYVCFEENYHEIKRGIRTKTHKLILAKNKQDATCERCGVIHGGVKEFYNLVEDPGELNNIYNEQNKIIIELKNKLDRYDEKNKLNKAISSIKLSIS